MKPDSVRIKISRSPQAGRIRLRIVQTESEADARRMDYYRGIMAAPPVHPDRIEREQ